MFSPNTSGIKDGQNDFPACTDGVQRFRGQNVVNVVKLPIANYDTSSLWGIRP